MIKPKIKNNDGEYKKDYDDLPKFISYYYQIKWVKRLNKKKILEIGIGNKTVSNYLKNNNFDVTTFDYDHRLNPDFVGDIRKLPFENKSFDVILCCEVLEHIPFEDFKKGLKEIGRVTKKHAIISIPYSCLRFELAARIHNRIFDFLIRIPTFFLRMPKEGEHYWELGRKGYSKRKIRRVIEKTGFKILKEETPILNPYHQFFILEKT